MKELLGEQINKFYAEAGLSMVTLLTHMYDGYIQILMDNFMHKICPPRSKRGRMRKEESVGFRMSSSELTVGCNSPKIPASARGGDTDCYDGIKNVLFGFEQGQEWCVLDQPRHLTSFFVIR